jgi:hypothetical protein
MFLQLKTLRKGAEDLKLQVNKDIEGGLPILSFAILAFIALVLYLIWDKLNQRISPTKKVGVIG